MNDETIADALSGVSAAANETMARIGDQITEALEEIQKTVAEAIGAAFSPLIATLNDLSFAASEGLRDEASRTLKGFTCQN